MNLGLVGSTAVVVGGSRGIGRATVLRLAEEGADTVAVARESTGLTELGGVVYRTTGRRIMPLCLDIDEPDAAAVLRETVEDLVGGTDILVNCVGNAPRGTLLELDDESWEVAWSRKVLPAVRLMRAFVPSMRERQRGVIVTISGLAGWEPTGPQLALGAVNAALINLTRALGRDLAPYGLRICGVAPGPVRTDRFVERAGDLAAELNVSVREAEDQIAQSIPRGRIAEPGDIASVIVFLASGLARHLTGVTVAVDGGQLSTI